MHGIIYQSSYVDTSQQNGIAIDTLMLLIPYYSLQICQKCSNESPIQGFQKFIPNSRLNPNVSLKVFGCTAFVHIHPHHQSKLDPRTIKCILIGYAPTQKGYKCFDPISKKHLLALMLYSLKKRLISRKPLFRGRI